MTRKRPVQIPTPREKRSFETIVIGTSLTEASDEFVRLPLAVVRALDAKVHLLHVMLAEPIGIEFDGVFGTDIFAGLKARKESDLAHQIWNTKLLDREILAAEVLQGVPHQALADRAVEAGAELIIVGASDDHGPSRSLPGSTTDRLIRSAHCPVLIVRNEMTIPPLQMLAPIDFSPTSALSIETGIRFLEQMKGEQVTAVRSLFAVSDVVRQLSRHLSPQQIDRMVKEELLRFTSEHTQGWEGSIESKVRIGDARHQVLQELAQFPPDLIVVGSHGHGQLRRALIGSVAGRVARKAAGSVLFVPFDASRVQVDEPRPESDLVDLSPRIEADSVPQNREADLGTPRRQNMQFCG